MTRRRLKAPAVRWAATCVRMRKLYPSLREIARREGVSDRALRNAIKSMGVGCG